MKIKINLYKYSKHASKLAGFTLIEILIALFIFTILSGILVKALHTVITTETSVEAKASRLRHLQIALLLMSREVTQAVNRPVKAANGSLDMAFMGSSTGFACTHAGFADVLGLTARSTLARTRYYFAAPTLNRESFPVLDQAPDSKSTTRLLLENLNDVAFRYIDHKGKAYNKWPVEEQPNTPLPSAVAIKITFKDQSVVTQLYVIPNQTDNSQAPDART